MAQDKKNFGKLKENSTLKKCHFPIFFLSFCFDDRHMQVFPKEKKSFSIIAQGEKVGKVQKNR